MEENLRGKLHLVNAAPVQKIFHTAVLLAPHLHDLDRDGDDEDYHDGDDHDEDYHDGEDHDGEGEPYLVNLASIQKI